MSFRRHWFSIALVIVCAPIGCAAAASNGFGGSGGASSAGGADAGSTGGGGGLSLSSGSTSSGGTGGQASFVAYAHTNKTLFKLDPMAPSLGLSKVGNFDCIGGQGQDTSMTDIAVNEQGEIWGISASRVYRLVIQGSSVHCAMEIPLNNTKNVKFYALTFAPVGVLDPAKEVLVAGNTDGELWAIDEQGNLSLHGNFGSVPANDGNGHTYPANHQGKRWELSGDIVFLANGGNPVGFATVRDCPSPPSTSGCNGTDTLIEIDVAKVESATTQSVTQSVRGQIVKKAGCSDAGNASGYGSMYGIAAWNDKVYGFSHSGAIVEIDNTDGSACLIQDTASDLWDGAGVTTTAPVNVPPPK